MSITLRTTGKVGTGLAIRREKAEDKTEQTFAHLKLADCFITRREIDALCDRPDAGWSDAFFDDMGAPLGLWTLVLHKVEFSATGRIHGPEPAEIKIANATFGNLEITFTKQGGLLAGTVTWLVAGDEAGDAEPLLGRECGVALVLTDGEQESLPLHGTLAQKLATGMAAKLEGTGISEVSVHASDGSNATVQVVEGPPA